MIPISIDTKGLSEEFGLTKEQISNLITSVIGGLTQKASERWKFLASQELGSTRDSYIQSLIIGSEANYIGYVMMISKSPLPIMLEVGCSSFDMKEGFEHSSKIRVKKGGGWYLTIPFRFAASTSLGENAIFSGKLPKEVEKIVKTLLPKQGLKIEQIPKELQDLKTRNKLVGKDKEGNNKEFDAYTHKHSIYEGLKHTSLPGSNRHNQYMNFRRVSDKSDPNAFIHPGFVAKNYKDKTIKSMDLFQEIDKLIDNFLKEEGF